MGIIIKFLESRISGVLFLLAAVALGSFLWYVKNIGYSQCERDNLVKGLSEIEQARIDAEEAHALAIADEDIDGLLRILGVMRKPENR